MKSRYSAIAASSFCIKPEYIHRPQPEYFDDVLTETDGITHQPDVYRFVHYLAQRFGCTNVIDLGCGAGGKLQELAENFNLLGVDYGDNIDRFRRAYPRASCLSHDFGKEELHIADRDLVSQSIVVCSDVIEHLPDPVPLLDTIHDLMKDAPVAVLTTPERDLVRGLEHAGPPTNPHHVREWSLREFESLLKMAGLNVLFAGLTANNDRDWAKRTILMVLGRHNSNPIESAPSEFRVTAFMCAYNEEDIVEAALHHLVNQGVRVHLVDNWSTDRTVELAERFLGRGLDRISRFPLDGRSATYDWHPLLSHVEDLSHASDADWCILYDADEIRESPWPHVRLKEAIYRVDKQGFNAIDHTCLVYHPTERQPHFDGERPETFAWFELGKRPGHFVQIKAWKHQTSKVTISDSGGHSAEFEGRRVYPFKFLLKHYPIRSQEHGRRKVFSDRQRRWNAIERSKGWHVQYDHVGEDYLFLRPSQSLVEFRPETFYSEYLLERLSGIGIERS